MILITTPNIRGLWRLAQPLRYTRGKDFLELPWRYYRFLQEWKQFNALGGDATFEEIAPCLFDSQSDTQSGGGHYFYQDIWALNKLALLQPTEHHDVGSRFDGFVGQATAICPVISWDIRPPNFQLPRFEFRQGSILDLPLDEDSIQSISCLHVAEHIGLGRYGDTLQPEGTVKALRELMRVLAPGGQLLFSLPIGRESVCFNAQRIWHPEKPMEICDRLELKEFKAVNDRNEFVEDATPQDFVNAKYSCGLYCFTK